MKKAVIFITMIFSKYSSRVIQISELFVESTKFVEYLHQSETGNLDNLILMSVPISSFIIMSSLR